MRFLLGWSAARSSRGERIEERPIGGNPFAGLTLVLSSRYLGGIAAFVFLMAAVNTFLYLQQAGCSRSTTRTERRAPHSSGASSSA